MQETVQRFGPNTGASNYRPGDFILTHRDAFYSKLVSWGQRLRFRGHKRPYAHWSHAAMVVDYDGTIIEALSHGVVVNHISEYTTAEYHLVSPAMGEHDRRQAVKFAQSCLGFKYSWTTIISLALGISTGTRLNVGFSGSIICSQLVAEALERGDYIFPRYKAVLMPADLAEHFDIRP